MKPALKRAVGWQCLLRAVGLLGSRAQNTPPELTDMDIEDLMNVDVAYFVGPLFDPKIPSYTRTDSNLSWQLSEKLSLSLVGQNLWKSLHQEYSGVTELPSLVRRNAYARFTWWF